MQRYNIKKNRIIRFTLLIALFYTVATQAQNNAISTDEN